jgi:uncharacterized phage protein (TIGR01671 family)
MRDNMGLYRGKRVDNGEWVEGYFYAGNITGAFILQTKTKCTRRRDGSSVLGDDVVPFEVDPSTVGEFTGLCDRKGRRIFEGDVVEFEYFDASDEDSKNWEFKRKTDVVTMARFPGYDVEVIGTIHDAKEG